MGHQKQWQSPRNQSILYASYLLHMSSVVRRYEFGVWSQSIHDITDTACGIHICIPLGKDDPVLGQWLTYNSKVETVCKGDFWKGGTKCVDTRYIWVYWWNVPWVCLSNAQSTSRLQWVEAFTWDQVSGSDGARWDVCALRRSIQGNLAWLQNSPPVVPWGYIGSCHGLTSRLSSLWWCHLQKSFSLGGGIPEAFTDHFAGTVTSEY